MARRRANGTLPTAHCEMCGRQLIDPVSVHRGYGPECAKKVEALETQRAALPNGSLVVVGSGASAGKLVEVVAFNRRNPRPFLVQFVGRPTCERYRFDQLVPAEGSAE